MKFITISRCLDCPHFESDYNDPDGGYYCDHHKGGNTPIENVHKILTNCPLPDDNREESER